jgi:hypothetical protein
MVHSTSTSMGALSCGSGGARGKLQWRWPITASKIRRFPPPSSSSSSFFFAELHQSSPHDGLLAECVFGSFCARGREQYSATTRVWQLVGPKGSRGAQRAYAYASPRLPRHIKAASPVTHPTVAVPVRMIDAAPLGNSAARAAELLTSNPAGGGLRRGLLTSNPAAAG